MDEQGKRATLSERLKRLLEVFDLRRFFRFGIIGVLNTLVDFCSYYVFNKVLLAGPYVSQTAAFLVAAVNSFLWNKFWTFSRKNPVSRQEVVRSLITNAGYLLLSLGFLRLFIRQFGLDAFVAKFPTGALMLLYNYLMSKFWIFAGGEKRP